MAVLRIVFMRWPQNSIIVYGPKAVKAFPGGAFLFISHKGATPRTLRGMPRVKRNLDLNLGFLWASIGLSRRGS